MSEDKGPTALAGSPEEPEHVAKFTPPREAVVDLLRKRLETRIQVVNGGPMDGVRVVAVTDLDKAFAEALPPASLFSAEVRTPAWVTVAAVCPRCGIPAEIGLDVKPELLIDSTGSELRLKGKSKARTHVCDQMTLIAEAIGQSTFHLTDIIGNEPAESGDEDEPDVPHG